MSSSAPQNIYHALSPAPCYRIYIWVYLVSFSRWYHRLVLQARFQDSLSLHVLWFCHLHHSPAQTTPFSVCHFKQQNPSLALLKEFVGRVWGTRRIIGDQRTKIRTQTGTGNHDKEIQLFLAGRFHHCCWALLSLAAAITTPHPSSFAVDEFYPSCLCSSSTRFNTLVGETDRLNLGLVLIPWSSGRKQMLSLISLTSLEGTKLSRFNRTTHNKEFPLDKRVQ